MIEMLPEALTLFVVAFLFGAILGWIARGGELANPFPPRVYGPPPMWRWSKRSSTLTEPLRKGSGEKPKTPRPMMHVLLLALVALPASAEISILASVPAAVDKTLATPRACFGLEEPDEACLRAMQDPPGFELALVTQAQFDVLQARVLRNEKIRDEMVGCTVESLIGTGGDLWLTGWSWDRCGPACKEANPAGLNSDARAGLKLGQTGAELGLCLLAAKHRNNGAPEGHRDFRWVARVLRMLPIVNNACVVIRGKPCINWGAPKKPEDALPVVASQQRRGR